VVESFLLRFIEGKIRRFKVIIGFGVFFIIKGIAMEIIVCDDCSG